MNISDMNEDAIHFISLKFDESYIFVEYVNGYEDNYYNEICIDLDNNTYTSKIRDIDKNELKKILNAINNRLYKKLSFNDAYYRQYDIIQLWTIIKQGLQSIKRLVNSQDKYISIRDYIDSICDYTFSIGENQINVLADEFKDVKYTIIDKFIEHYYNLYLIYGYKLFSISDLSNETNTDYNPIIDQFFKSIANAEDYYTDDYIEKSPDIKLIMQYANFVRTFPFQLSNDLNNNFEDDGNEENNE